MFGQIQFKIILLSLNKAKYIKLYQIYMNRIQFKITLLNQS